MMNNVSYVGGAGGAFQRATISPCPAICKHPQTPGAVVGMPSHTVPPTDLRPVHIVFSACRSGIQSRAPRLLVCGGVGRTCLSSWKAASSIPASVHKCPKLLRKSPSLRGCTTVDHMVSATPPTLVSDTPPPTFRLILCLFH